MKPTEIRDILGRLDSQLKSLQDSGMDFPVEITEQTEAFCGAAENLREFVEDMLGGAPPASQPEGSQTEPSGGIPVLLVEDNLVNRKLAILILEKMGCRVDVAVNGQEGVEMFQKGRYSAIFMDCQMPVMDGYEATRQIRRHEGGQSHIPIIAVTANAMKGDREKCLSCGMDDYIPKPLRPHDLQEAVQRWCQAPVG